MRIPSIRLPEDRIVQVAVLFALIGFVTVGYQIGRGLGFLLNLIWNFVWN